MKRGPPVYYFQMQIQNFKMWLKFWERWVTTDFVSYWQEKNLKSEEFKADKRGKNRETYHTTHYFPEMLNTFHKCMETSVMKNFAIEKYNFLNVASSEEI